MDSSAINRTVDSSDTDAEEDKILIYDWVKDDEVIAEGRLESTDPKKLVINIPLGPKVAIVKVDMVLNKNGSIWRPNEEMLMIGDTLGISIRSPRLIYKHQLGYQKVYHLRVIVTAPTPTRMRK